MYGFSRNLTAAVVAGVVVFGSGAMAQDVAKGEKLFKKCKACHMIGPEARNKTGPDLTGVIGRIAGTFDGFGYSKSMAALGETGFIWSEDLVFEYLLSPKKFLRKALGDKRAKANMSFRLKGAQDRRDVIAYLAGFSMVDVQESSAEPTAAGMMAEVDTENKICVVNGTQESHYFLAEARGVDRANDSRVLGTLAPGETLCTGEIVGADAARGVVSVFESPDELDGCSRLVNISAPETLTLYADFDRCGWSSHG
ncbi:MAG: c-type cytochrome [Rhodobacterales bacterium]|nr:c-type cytochrome [Rhodobacterales bacterium]